ncbi:MULTISPECIES: hypothetical protein [Asaia]|uniref:Uncharacterized protein n=2 Tax=Asaia TaxID=91914 RepID=A0A060QLG4_9PROT|nr:MULTISPECIES: hypothetical protein [Asaia]MDL2171020.1 hypothetical protein [Asaia sp. HumB]CDG40721.1 hypothetical protein ASAP_2676 [Asaia bogorensis]
MASARQNNRVRAVFWLLSLFAVAMRLVAGSPVPAFTLSSDDPQGMLSALEVLCDSTAPASSGGKHHDTVCADDTACLVSAMESHAPLLTALVLASVLAGPGLYRCFWRFPPIRGPPCDGFVTRSAQGPPAIT